MADAAGKGVHRRSLDRARNGPGSASRSNTKPSARRTTAGLRKPPEAVAHEDASSAGRSERANRGRERQTAVCDQAAARDDAVAARETDHRAERRQARRRMHQGAADDGFVERQRGPRRGDHSAAVIGAAGCRQDTGSARHVAGEPQEPCVQRRPDGRLGMVAAGVRRRAQRPTVVATLHVRAGDADLGVRGVGDASGAVERLLGRVGVERGEARLALREPDLSLSLARRVERRRRPR
jgi:hypothetical protein